MLSFITTASLKAVFGISMLGVSMLNVWLFGHNVRQAMLGAGSSLFGGLPTVPQSMMGPIRLPTPPPPSDPVIKESILPHDAPITEPWWYEDEEFTGPAYSFSRFFFDKTSFNLHTFFRETSPVFYIDEVVIKCILFFALIVGFISFCRYEMPQQQIVIEPEIIENCIEEEPITQALTVYDFTNHVDRTKEQCDVHHATYNHPEWSCDHCRRQQQNIVTQEHKIHDLEATLELTVSDLTGLRSYAAKYGNALSEAVEENGELKTQVAHLKIQLSQAINRAETAENVAKTVNQLLCDKTQTLETVREHYAHVVDMNRNLCATNEENEVTIRDLQLDVHEAKRVNDSLKQSITRYQIKFERQLEECKDRMEFMAEYNHPR